MHRTTKDKYLCHNLFMIYMFININYNTGSNRMNRFAETLHMETRHFCSDWWWWSDLWVINYTCSRSRAWDVQIIMWRTHNEALISTHFISYARHLNANHFDPSLTLLTRLGAVKSKSPWIINYLEYVHSFIYQSHSVPCQLLYTCLHGLHSKHGSILPILYRRRGVSLHSL